MFALELEQLAALAIGSKRLKQPSRNWGLVGTGKAEQGGMRGSGDGGFPHTSPAAPAILSLTQDAQYIDRCSKCIALFMLLET